MSQGDTRAAGILPGIIIGGSKTCLQKRRQNGTCMTSQTREYTPLHVLCAYCPYRGLVDTLLTAPKQRQLSVIHYGSIHVVERVSIVLWAVAHLGVK